MTRYSLAEVTAWGPADFEIGMEALQVSDLGYTPDQAKSAVTAWVYLLGAASDDDIEKARYEALSDTAIFVCLNKPVNEFMTWFRREEWEFFGRDDDERHSWAWAVLDRCRALEKALGPHLACQLSVCEGVKRIKGRK